MGTKVSAHSSFMLASHCPELDTRWPHEYGILNFAQDGPELGRQPINSRSNYDAYRRSHDGNRITHGGNTKM